MKNTLQQLNQLISQPSLKILSVIVLGTLFVACSPNARVVEPEANVVEETEEPIAQNNEPITQTGENVTVNDINRSLEELIGQTITVRSEVQLTGDSNSFLLTDDNLFGGEDVLVINTSGHTFVLPTEEDMDVQVTGEVQRFVTEEADNLGLPIVPTDYSAYEQQPVLFASSITLSPDPDELVENPTQFYGETLAIEGEVSEALGGNAFMLREPGLLEGESLLVLNRTPTLVLEPGAMVVVTGELRPFVVSELERDYDITWDLEIQRELEAEYQEQPVFVARDVYPSNQ